MSQVGMKVDIAHVKAAKSQAWTVLRDGKLHSFWAARISAPGLKPVVLGENGKMHEFATETEATVYAEKKAAEWRAEAQQEAQP